MFRTELLIMVDDFIKSHTIKDDLLGEYLDFKNINQALVEFGNKILDNIENEEKNEHTFSR